MIGNNTELSSLSAQLEELVSRVDQIRADAHDEDEDLSLLTEIERQLRTASRRLTKFVNGIK